jgi:hypothetical protein
MWQSNHSIVVFFTINWKIRQLTQQLITQNNHIDIATGILTASLNLTRIDNIEKENAKTKLGENKTKWKEDRLLISTEKILL